MFLSLITSEPDNSRYIERTAERLRAMSAHTTGLEGADPVQVRARIDLVDIPTYKAELGGTDDMAAFRAAVIKDLTERRDELCPVKENGGIRCGEVPRYRFPPSAKRRR